MISPQYQKRGIKVFNKFRRVLMLLSEHSGSTQDLEDHNRRRLLVFLAFVNSIMLLDWGREVLMLHSNVLSPKKLNSVQLISSQVCKKEK